MLNEDTQNDLVDRLAAAYPDRDAGSFTNEELRQAIAQLDGLPDGVVEALDADDLYAVSIKWISLSPNDDLGFDDA